MTTVSHFWGGAAQKYKKQCVFNTFGVFWRQFRIFEGVPPPKSRILYFLRNCRQKRPCARNPLILARLILWEAVFCTFGDSYTLFIFFYIYIFTFLYFFILFYTLPWVFDDFGNSRRQFRIFYTFCNSVFLNACVLNCFFLNVCARPGFHRACRQKRRICKLFDDRRERNQEVHTHSKTN